MNLVLHQNDYCNIRNLVLHENVRLVFRGHGSLIECPVGRRTLSNNLDPPLSGETHNIR